MSQFEWIFGSIARRDPEMFAHLAARKAEDYLDNSECFAEFYYSVNQNLNWTKSEALEYWNENIEK
jgi:prephenate dehydrogenase